MPDQFLIDYLSSIFGKEILALTAISGYLVLVSYFYGPAKWKKGFSDFDKFAFALMIGLTVYYFFAIPMDQIKIIEDIHVLNIYTFMLIFAGGVGLTRILLNEPLCGNKTAFFRFFQVFIALFLIAFSFIDSLFRLFLSGAYSEYAPHHSSQLINDCMKDVFYVVISFFMLLLLLSILHGYEPIKCIKERLNQLRNSKVICTVIFVAIILLLLSNPIGNTFSPSIEEGEIFINSYTLEPFCVDRINKDFGGQAEVEKTYNISTNLIGCTPIDNLIGWIQIELIGWIPIEVTGRYLFRWDDVPGNDSERLLKYLMDDHGIGWVESAEIYKSDDGKTIHIFKGKKSAEITISGMEGKATLKIGEDGRTHNLKTKNGNGRLNIYNWVSITKVLDKIDNSTEYSYSPNESYFTIDMDKSKCTDVEVVMKGTRCANLNSTEFKYIYERNRPFEKELEIRNLTLVNNKSCKINIDHIDIRKNINYGMSLDDFLELQCLASDKNGRIGGYNENEGGNVFILNDLTLDKKSNITFQLDFIKTR